MKRIAILIASVSLLGACSRGYRAEPVVGPNDIRSTGVPDLSDSEGRAKQKCFKISIFHEGWAGVDREDEGIACMVELEVAK